jgi:hypothetical protein
MPWLIPSLGAAFTAGLPGIGGLLATRGESNHIRCFDRHRGQNAIRCRVHRIEFHASNGDRLQLNAATESFSISAWPYTFDDPASTTHNHQLPRRSFGNRNNATSRCAFSVRQVACL